MFLYQLNKLINWRYLILDNTSLFSYFFNNDINLSKFNFIEQQYTNYKFEYLNTDYEYFNNFIDVQSNYKQSAENIANFIKQNNLYINTNEFEELLSISKTTEKKWNIIKNWDYYISGYQIEYEKLEMFQKLLNKFNIKGFYYMDINTFNPYIFINKSISNFIDLVLMWLGVDSKRIKQYIESIWISVDNIIVNLLNDKDFFEKVKWLIKQDIVWKYFQLLVWKKIQTLWRVYINFYMITKEINWLHINLYPVLENNIITLKNNNNFEAISYVELNKIQQNLNPIAYHFWNIYKPYYAVWDRMDILYKENVEQLLNFTHIIDNK